MAWVLRRRFVSFRSQSVRGSRGGVATVGVGPALDEVEDGHPRLGLGSESTTIGQLALERRKEALWRSHEGGAWCGYAIASLTSSAFRTPNPTRSSSIRSSGLGNGDGYGGSSACVGNTRPSIGRDDGRDAKAHSIGSWSRRPPSSRRPPLPRAGVETETRERMPRWPERRMASRSGPADPRDASDVLLRPENVRHDKSSDEKDTP